MKKNWWKLLAILLLFYAILTGLLVPLKPGIISIEPSILKEGQNSAINVIGYNTRFKSYEKNLKIWLGNSSETVKICADNFTVKNEDHLTVNFTIPSQIPEKSLHLFVNNEADGTVFLENGMRANSSVSIDKSSKLTTCTISDKNNSANYFGFPYRELLYETIRNLIFHVPMWFTMMAVLFFGMIKSIQVLMKGKPEDDLIAQETVNVGLLFATLGLLTGATWARFTWGAWWLNDPQLNGAATTTLIYVAYVILRSSINEEQKRARISAIYNIFAFCMLIVFIEILPKTTDSLHPGKGGNPAFSTYDLDSSLRAIFYPATLGWILLGVWIASLRWRMAIAKRKIEYENF